MPPPPFGRLLTAMVTPFNADGALDLDAAAALATYLVDHGLVDEFRLLTFPVYLGTGKKLFTDGVTPGALKLLSSTTSSTGVVISSYEPTGAPEYGSYGLDVE